MVCHGFDLDVPIEITVNTPDLSDEHFQVNLALDSTSNCQSVDDDCRGDQLRHLTTPADEAPQTFEVWASTVHGTTTGALGGWVLPGTPPGLFFVTAQQGSLRAEHVLEVHRVNEPSINVGTWFDADGRRRHTALLVGFEPGADVPLALYRLTGSAAPAPWAFQMQLGSVSVDANGEALWTFEAPPDLAAGQYCVLAVETIPDPPDDASLDPCHDLGQFDASINVP